MNKGKGMHVGLEPNAEAGSHALSDTSVHNDAVRVIYAFLEPLSGLRESDAMKRSGSRWLDLTAMGFMTDLLGDKSFSNQSQFHKCLHHNRNMITKHF
jgi:hypothetical protein